MNELQRHQPKLNQLGRIPVQNLALRYGELRYYLVLSLLKYFF